MDLRNPKEGIMGLGRFVGLGLGYAAHGFLRAARSLTDAEIEGLAQKVVAAVAKATGGALRT